jgi:uncharacterized protein (TIGR02266 family)
LKAGSSRGVLLIGFERAEAARMASTLAQVGHRAYPAWDAREAATILGAVSIGLALADLEGSFTEVLGAIEAVRAAGCPRCPLLGVGSVEAGAAMTDALRALGLEGLVPTGVSPQELIFRVNAVLYADRQAASRASRRVPVDLPARFEGIGGPVEGRILNLSESGLFLAAERLLPTNRTVTVGFTLEAEAEPIVASCRVVWTNAGGDGQRYFQGMGLQFLQMRPATRLALQAFLAGTMAGLDPGRLDRRS